jgi:GNAT superfamily N-acetyltransferase
LLNPNATGVLRLAQVQAADFDAMVEIRIAALQESLERLGRFDPVRARERLAAGFIPEFMNHIELDARRVGFITLRPDGGALKLDHLYLLPLAQGQGIGAWALNWAKAKAQAMCCDITLSALRQSDANRFYLRHGFSKTSESEFDIDYRWYVGEVDVA